MAGTINSYINPFSSEYEASARHFHDLSLGSKILTIFFTALAFIVSIPVAGIAGFAAFRSLVDRLAPIDKSFNSAVKKTDDVAAKKFQTPEERASNASANHTKVEAELPRLELQMEGVKIELSSFDPATLFENELKAQAKLDEKLAKLSKLAELYQISHSDFPKKQSELRRQILKLSKTQRIRLLKRLDALQANHKPLNENLLAFYVKVQPQIAKLFLDIDQEYLEKNDQKLEFDTESSLRTLDGVCYFVHNLFARISADSSLHCDISSLPQPTNSPGLISWVTSLVAYYVGNYQATDDKKGIHELVLSPAEKLQKKVGQELNQRLVERNRLEAAQAKSAAFGVNKGQSNRRTTGTSGSYGGYWSNRTCDKGGLHNLGNTCFMNSSLQVILNTSLAKLIDQDIPEPVFSDYYHDNIEDILLVQFLHNPDLIIDNEDLKSAVKKFREASEDYQKIMAHLKAMRTLKDVYEGKNTSITLHKALSDFRQVVIDRKTRMVELPPSYSQQDAAEFMSAALRGIHYVFQMKKTVRSKDQQDESTIHEPAHYLSLQIVANKGKVTFQDLLEAYKAEHKNDPHNKWVYHGRDAVREHQEYTQIYEIADQIPDTLVVQIKRFRYNKEGRIARKNSTPVEIGEEVDFRTLFEEGLVTDGVSTKYRVVGIVNHVGEINSGHYTAEVKIDGKWEHRSDSSVTKSVSDLVLKGRRETGYMFVFERIQ